MAITGVAESASAKHLRAVGDDRAGDRHAFLPLFRDEMPMPVAPQRRKAQAGVLAQIVGR